MTSQEFDQICNRGADPRPLGDNERRNADTVLATYAAFAGRWDVEEQRAHYTPDFKDHSTMHGATFTDLAAFVSGFRQAFPRGSVTIERLLIDGDFVTAKVKGRLSPEHAPDEAIEIYRLEDGRIAEHWDVIRPQPGLNVIDAAAHAVAS